MTSHRKRPRDPSQLAKLIVDIAAGEIEDTVPEASPAAKQGRIGGLKRAAKLSPERRAEVAKKAARARWRKGPAPRVKKERV